MALNNDTVVIGTGGVPIEVEKKVPVDIPNDKMGDYVQQRIDLLEQERLHYQRAANGLKGTSLLLQQALRKLNPKAPELSREWLDKAYDMAVERNAIEDKSVHVVNSSPTLAELGLGQDGKPLSKPAPARPANAGANDSGGFFGKLGKLLGSDQADPQPETQSQDRQARFIEALKKRGVSDALIMEALQEAS